MEFCDDYLSQSTLNYVAMLMFLAYIFPISERSAVNLYSKNNTTNVTHFDTKEAYTGAADDSNNDIGNENGSSDNASKASDQEVGEEHDLEEMAPVADDESKGAEVDPYTEYRDFWTLQNLLSADLKTTKPAELRNSMNKVLSSLEAHKHAVHPRRPSEGRRCRRHQVRCGESTSASGSGSEAGWGWKGERCRQHRSEVPHRLAVVCAGAADSQFRQQVCIQILMACQHRDSLRKTCLKMLLLLLLLLLQLQLVLVVMLAVARARWARAKTRRGRGRGLRQRRPSPS